MSKLKKITAPTLGHGYGMNIKETFSSIDSNFGILGNTELYRGDDGTSLITVQIPMNKLMSSSPFNIDGISNQIISQREFIQRALIELGGSDNDVSAMINQLSSSPDSVMACLSNPDDENSILDVLAVIPYVIIDRRFQNISGTGENLMNAMDMSCTLTITGKNKWSARQTFPTLYYKTGRNAGMYWRIGGNGTLINARGPAGKDGESGKIYVCTVENASITGDGYFSVSKMLNSDSTNPSTMFIEPDEFNNTYSIVEGSTVFVIPSGQSPSGGDFKYYISTILYRDSQWMVYLGTQNSCYVQLGVEAFRQVMMNIDTTNDNLKGLFIPLSATATDPSKPGFIMFADKNSNTLSIVGVSDIDSDTLIEDNKISYSFKSDVDVYINGAPKVQTYIFDSLDPDNLGSGLMDTDTYQYLKVSIGESESNVRGYYWKGTPYFKKTGINPGPYSVDSHSTTGWTNLNSVPTDYKEIYAFSTTLFPTDNELIYLTLKISDNKYGTTYEAPTASTPYITNKIAAGDPSRPYSLVNFGIWDGLVRVGTASNTTDAYLKKPINIVSGKVYVSNNLVVGDELTVGGDTSVSGGLSVGKNMKVGEDLQIDGNANVSDGLKVIGDGEVRGNFSVDKTITARKLVLSGATDMTCIISPMLTAKSSGVTMPTNVSMGRPNSSHNIVGSTTFKNKLTVSKVSEGAGDADFVRINNGSVLDIIGKDGNGGVVGKVQTTSEVYKWGTRMALKNAIVRKSICYSTTRGHDTIALENGSELENNTYSVSNPFTGIIKLRTNLPYTIGSDDDIDCLGVSKNTENPGLMSLPVMHNNTQYFDKIDNGCIITDSGRTTESNNEQPKYSCAIAFDMGTFKMSDFKIIPLGHTGNGDLFGYDWTTNQIKFNMNVFQPIIEAVINTAQDSGGYGDMTVNIDYNVYSYIDDGSIHPWKNSSNWNSGTNKTLPCSNWVHMPGVVERVDDSTFVNTNITSLHYRHSSEIKDWSIPANADGTKSFHHITLYGKQPKTDILCTINIPNGNVSNFNNTCIQAVMIVTFGIKGGRKRGWGRLWGKKYCDINKVLDNISIWGIRSSYSGKDESYSLNRNSGTIVDHGVISSSIPERLALINYNPATIFASSERGSKTIQYSGAPLWGGNLNPLIYPGTNLSPFITFSMYDLNNVNTLDLRQRLYICPDGLIISGGAGQYMYIMQREHDSGNPNQRQIAAGFTVRQYMGSRRTYRDLVTGEVNDNIKWYDTYI